MRNPLRIASLFSSVVRLTLDLRRLDRVFDINDRLMKLRTSEETASVVEDFRRGSAARAALDSRRRLGRLDVPALASLPAETLGGAFGRFMRSRGLSPDSLPELEAATDIDYLVAHLYETHDLWHVVTGFDTDPAGEAALQAFYLAQQRSYLPLFVLAAILLNTALFAYDEKHARLDGMTRGWQLGRQAQPMTGIDWRKHLARPLADVRRELGLPTDSALPAGAA